MENTLTNQTKTLQTPANGVGFLFSQIGKILTLAQQVSIYKTWCTDNKVSPSDGKSLQSYFKEMEAIYE